MSRSTSSSQFRGSAVAGWFCWLLLSLLRRLKVFSSADLGTLGDTKLQFAIKTKNVGFLGPGPHEKNISKGSNDTSALRLRVNAPSINCSFGPVIWFGDCFQQGCCGGLVLPTSRSR